MPWRMILRNASGVSTTRGGVMGGATKWRGRGAGRRSGWSVGVEEGVKGKGKREREREGKGKALLLQSSSPCRPWGMGEGKERLEGRKEKKRKEKRNKGDMSLSFRCDCYL